MKIEKLTENKIRVIMSYDDFEEKEKETDINTLMLKAMKTQRLFLDILTKAEQEVAFYTDGCKLLIEAFSSLDDVLIFTITKFLPNDLSKSYEQLPKKLTVKRKVINMSSKEVIYSFESFDCFCNFCQAINNIGKFNIKNLSKNISLYCYKNTYYLVIKNINIKYENIDTFYSVISEFGKFHSDSVAFENKLIEHGDHIIKKDAINVAINYFVK